MTPERYSVIDYLVRQGATLKSVVSSERERSQFRRMRERMRKNLGGPVLPTNLPVGLETVVINSAPAKAELLPVEFEEVDEEIFIESNFPPEDETTESVFVPPLALDAEKKIVDAIPKKIKKVVVDKNELLRVGYECALGMKGNPAFISVWKEMAKAFIPEFGEKKQNFTPSDFQKVWESLMGDEDDDDGN